MRTYVRDRLGQFASSPDGGPVGRGAKASPKRLASGTLSARAGAGPTKAGKGSPYQQMKRSRDAATGGRSLKYSRLVDKAGEFHVVDGQRIGGPPPSPFTTYSDAAKPYYITEGRTVRGFAPKPYYTADGQTIRGPVPRSR